MYGTVAPRFESVRALVQESLEVGDEVGVSLCAILDGDVVVDLWGGVADEQTGSPWQRDTIVNTFSITKTMVALVALVLIDRGELDPDAPVARYWPEFAAAGKADVLVRHLLGHTSGLAGWQTRVTVDDVCDVQRTTDLLASQEPWWCPGDGSGYHAMTFGHLIGEIVRRITGTSLGRFFATELADPLGADYFIGTPAEADPRVARLVPPPVSSADWSRVPPDSVMRKALLNPVVDVSKMATRQWRAAELGAMNGHGNARSVARIQSLVSHQKLSTDRIFEVQSDSVDRVLAVGLRFGLGYALPGREIPLPGERVCWWSGYGGSLVINDLDRRLTIAFVMNKMAAGLMSLARATRYVNAIYSEVPRWTRSA